MEIRTLTRTTYDPLVVDFGALDGFQREAVAEIKVNRTEINELRVTVLALQHNFETFKQMVDWIGRHHPEAITNYHTTKAVINRLEDNNDFSEAEMVEEMRITP
jgi:hypothetical protein